ncbi:ATP/GTP-binding protein [Streptomyces sp. ASQP_92]|uniref:ATP/GTP-binding protein n=1 Tax=Streptomyces sp. ASQP_92 TaxID=2979116 RepID=UPI0028F6F355|nr:ATP/GTP-binding protein [Streptomyces sp. ASQP_92]
MAERGMDLRTLFSTNDRALRAEEAFTNRQAQWQIIAEALADHLHTISSPGFDVEDLEAARRNVVALHGVGGIGKTALSRTIEAALADTSRRPAQWGAPSWPEHVRILPVRIDLARSEGIDFERVVLLLRLALAATGRPMPAFDLTLRRYWEAAHPGEPLEEYLRRGGLLAKFGKALPQQMEGVLGEVAQALLLPGVVGSAVGKVTGALVTALRERRQAVRALAGCTRLADLLEAEPTLDALSFYPHLLSWDISQLPAKERVVPVVLFDTWEEIGDRTHRDLERLLQRVVWLMPQTFFVITGRARLQWGDAGLEGQLDWTGPAAWPGLAATPLPSPRTAAARSAAPAPGGQILIGDFSREDADDYLARRLTRDGQPLIEPAIRAVIAERSHGLPLHLDLSAMRYLEIRRSGRTPQPDDFAADFPALVARTLQDLTPDERHVLRSVSLFDSFDLSLATQAAGLTHEAPALRLAERPFIRENTLSRWPFSLHALIRSTIRSADDQTDDRWSPRDWDHAARRAFTALGGQWTAHTGRDRLLLTGALRQGLAIARDFRLDLDWLADATWAYVADEIWEPIALPSAPEPTGDPAPLATSADALVETLSALARRQHEHRERTITRLTAVVTADLLPADLTELAVYYLAKAHRDLGHSAESRAGMQRVADGGGQLAPAARRGLAHLARLDGDFPAALQTAQSLGWEGRRHRVEGDVRWVQGDMTGAIAAYERARAEAEQHGVAGERVTAQAQLGFATAFADPHRAAVELELAEQLLAGADLRATTITTHIAALIQNAGTSAGLEDRAQRLRTEISVAGLDSAQLPTLELALAFHHAVRGDRDGVTAALSRLHDLAQGGDYAYYPDIARFMAGLPLPEPGSGARWLDGQQVTRDRWRALVTARADHLRIPR